MRLMTIGHSTLQLDELVEMLRRHGVTAIADVRSHPYSQRLPQFNRGVLASALEASGISYVFLGKELGGRSSDPSHYVNGKIAYAHVAKSRSFADGISRLLNGLRLYSIALLCAEKEPLSCHRTILICRNLRRHDIDIAHILADGSVETHSAAEQRLVQLWNLDQPSMFSSSEDLLERAYDLQGDVIAFVKPDPGKGISVGPEAL